MLFLITLLLVIIFLSILNLRKLKEVKYLATDIDLDSYASSLPENEEACKDMLKIVNSKCNIELDSETKSSAYIFFQNKIILSNNNSSQTNYSRFLFIAHECIHSIQDKKIHIINFIMTNLLYLFFIISGILIVLGKSSEWLLLTLLLISFMQFYFRITLETDAMYRSITLAEMYLKDKNADKLIERYHYIIPHTIDTVYFIYLVPILVGISILTILFLIF